MFSQFRRQRKPAAQPAVLEAPWEHISQNIPRVQVAPVKVPYETSLEKHQPKVSSKPPVDSGPCGASDHETEHSMQFRKTNGDYYDHEMISLSRLRSSGRESRQVRKAAEGYPPPVFRNAGSLRGMPPPKRAPTPRANTPGLSRNSTFSSTSTLVSSSSFRQTGPTKRQRSRPQCLDLQSSSLKKEKSMCKRQPMDMSAPTTPTLESPTAMSFRPLRRSGQLILMGKGRLSPRIANPRRGRGMSDGRIVHHVVPAEERLRVGQVFITELPVPSGKSLLFG
ncbi:hypothetical protein B0H67DRAFT_243454 [Lasiosphaeris hirsuta]|uniref:Uncharacterized protein n=1 Tax=Lasiosphaeris hirsuta TaxID=260670 RepID=A0AA40AGX3_9PEZI|nr:hypothetical protein B0H67DRAFT_243454 [Lasiosphaeris hirsuta]